MPFFSSAFFFALFHFFFRVVSLGLHGRVGDDGRGGRGDRAVSGGACGGGSGESERSLRADASSSLRRSEVRGGPSDQREWSSLRRTRITDKTTRQCKVHACTRGEDKIWGWVFRRRSPWRRWQPWTTRRHRPRRALAGPSPCAVDRTSPTTEWSGARRQAQTDRTRATKGVRRGVRVLWLMTIANSQRKKGGSTLSHRKYERLAT